MIDPALQSSKVASGTVEELAAAIAEMIAHLYIYAGTELARRPDEPAGEQLLNRLFVVVADFDDISKKTSGETVRQVLGDHVSTPTLP